MNLRHTLLVALMLLWVLPAKANAQRFQRPVAGPEPIPPTFIPPTGPQFRPPPPSRPPPGTLNGRWVWDDRWNEWRWNDLPQWQTDWQNDWHWWNGRWHIRRHPRWW